MRSIGTAVALAVLLVAPGAGQTPADWQSRLPPGAVAPLAALVAEAEAEGLPVGPLVQKALEGAAKGVDAERIVAAVRIYRAELRDARYLLSMALPGMSAEPGDIVAVAFALHRGLPPADVSRLLAVAPADRRDVAVQVAADIVARGYQPDEAARLVADAIVHRLPSPAVLGLPRAIGAELERGASPADALGRVRAQVLQGPPRRAP